MLFAKAQVCAPPWQQASPCASEAAPRSRRTDLAGFATRSPLVMGAPPPSGPLSSQPSSCRERFQGRPRRPSRLDLGRGGAHRSRGRHRPCRVPGLRSRAEVAAVVRRRLHQRREAVQEGPGLRVLGRRPTMTDADQLLKKIIKAGDVIWQDAAGRTKLLLTLDAADLERLATFRALAAEREGAGDGGLYRVRPVSPCWLDAARAPAPPRPTGRLASVDRHQRRRRSWREQNENTRGHGSSIVPRSAPVLTRIRP